VYIPELEAKFHEYLKQKGIEYLPPFDDETPLLDS